MSRIRRHRAKIALILGCLLGANYKPILKNAADVVSVITDGDNIENPIVEAIKKRQIRKELESGPDACHLYKKTALSEGRYMQIHCEGMARYLSENDKALFEKNEEKSIGSAAEIATAIKWYKKDTPDKSKKIDFDKVLSDAVKLDSPVLLKNLAEPYRTELRDFDPKMFELLSDSLYIQDHYTGVDDDMQGHALGDGQFMGNRFLPKENGKYQMVTVQQALPQVNFDEILRQSDGRNLSEFLGVMMVLAHEISGHSMSVTDLRSTDSISEGRMLCGKNGLAAYMEGEIEAYAIAAEMIDNLGRKYPPIQALMRQEKDQHEKLRKERRAESIFDPGVEVELRKKFNEGSLMLDPFSVALHSLYQEAKETQDWFAFRDYITASILSKQFGLIYLLGYFKGSDGLSRECHQEFNLRVKAVLHSGRPEISRIMNDRNGYKER